jgi:hypothetical protein
VGIAFLADQSRKSMYKARYMRDTVNLSTKLYSELTGEESGGAGNENQNQNENGGGNQNQGGNENQGGGGTTNPPSGGGNEND